MRVSTRCPYGQHHLGVGLPFPIPGALLRIYPRNEGGLSVWVAVLDIPPREAGDWESGVSPALKEITSQGICIKSKSEYEKGDQMLAWEEQGQRRGSSSKFMGLEEPTFFSPKRIGWEEAAVYFGMSAQVSTG